MGLKEIRKPSRGVRTEKDLTFIKNQSEREFARLILIEFPHLHIVYEPHSFVYLDENGILRNTIPDFFIKRRGSQRLGIFVEITTYPNEEAIVPDPKHKQKKVMESVAPDRRYVVLYRENLQRIQSKFPTYDFGLASKVPVLVDS